ncbi:hypothetical protein BDA96_03G090600 [Sorghum bicolor]|jgi:hypothetical protein|uniref:Uncharacterized protein n=2 Tax=Sorghum bicolor TaxID=4558 RepID=A0A921RB63_SORBI|nr:hypothetical protein SORBI_3003G086500 [Sorghum bicolor]KAG0536750.1 hypothetical protein BDA96_03G090600 [Sorghum bicolor]
MQATKKRPPRRYPAAPIVMCLVLAWACLHGDTKLLAAAAVPLPRRRPTTSSVAAGTTTIPVVGSRPKPQGVAAGRRSSSPSSSTAGIGVGDDKRQIPSCPDALHNR